MNGSDSPENNPEDTPTSAAHRYYYTEYLWIRYFQW